MRLIDDIKNNWEDVIHRAKNAATSSVRDFSEITIVAVSKTHPVETVVTAIDAGIHIFGENYVQELRDKYKYFEDNSIVQPEWQYIGHLQTNKVKYLAPFVSMIHSVDTVKLAKEISKQAIKNNRTIDILLQVNTSGEMSKSGCEPDQTENLLLGVKEIPNIRIKGLMTIGSFSDDENIYRNEFKTLRNLKNDLKEKYPETELKHLSMGMTHDFEAAIEEGATIIRVGTAIFGARDYSN